MKLPTTPSFRLEGKCAMVAGGSSGSVLAVRLRWLRQGRMW